jgi:hypothetical protein
MVTTRTVLLADVEFEEFVSRCKGALAKTLVAFYPVAGRLVVSGHL